MIRYIRWGCNLAPYVHTGCQLSLHNLDSHIGLKTICQLSSHTLGLSLDTTIQVVS